MSSYINQITEANVRDFAESCYDTNVVSELALVLDVPDGDRWDKFSWTLDAHQWRQAITAALLDLAEDCDYVVCYSRDGWSIHDPGSTDEQIASGEAGAIASASWAYVPGVA